MSDGTADTIEQYVGKITSIARTWESESTYVQPWFRGIGNSAEHKLEPSLYRLWDADPLDCEANMRRDFASQALPFVDSTYKRDDWEWYFLMQHYGVPTRLLDWTESALIALRFALYTWDAKKVELPAVWVLNPIELNAITRPSEAIAVPSGEDLTEYLPVASEAKVTAEIPIPIRPNYTDRRMIAQQSRFTLHGCVRTPLEDMPELQVLRKEHFLVRLLIQVTDENLERWKRSLSLLGVLNSTVFPDLAGLAGDIREAYTLGDKSIFQSGNEPEGQK